VKCTSATSTILNQCKDLISFMFTIPWTLKLLFAIIIKTCIFFFISWLRCMLFVNMMAIKVSTHFHSLKQWENTPKTQYLIKVTFPFTNPMQYQHVTTNIIPLLNQYTPPSLFFISLFSITTAFRCVWFQKTRLRGKVVSYIISTINVNS